MSKGISTGLSSKKHIIQVVLALLLFISFLMPMFQVSAWKNVSLKNDSKGNGITMLSISSSISKGLASAVRKAKLADGVTTTIAQDGAKLSLAGWCMVIGLICVSLILMIVFTNNLGVRWGNHRPALIIALCVIALVCLAVSTLTFLTFRDALNTAAAETDEALAKVTAKLYQGDSVPTLKVGIWVYIAAALLLLMISLQLLPDGKIGFQRSLLWFTLPALCMYTAFVIYPALSSIHLGFTAYDGVTEASMRFVGFDNYTNIFGSQRFLHSLGNTLIIAFSFTILVNVFALMLALIVDKIRWGKNIFRSCFYLPVLISGIIAGFIWRIMFNYSFGVINFVLNSVGLASVKFIDVMPNALLSIIFVILWKQVGYYMIIYLAALQGISKDLLEASSIDGANSAQTFRHITIPMLAGSFTINLTLALINGLKVFDEIAILTDGGPGFSTETVTYMIYKVAFGEMRQGYGTAMAVILFLIILVLGGFQSTMLRKREVQL